MATKRSRGTRGVPAPALLAVVLAVVAAGAVLVVRRESDDGGRPVAFGPARPGEKVPAPRRYSGSGSSTISVTRPEEGLTILHVRSAAALTMTEVDDADEAVAAMLDVPARYDGVSVLAGVRATPRLRVETSGEWTVELRSARTAPSVATTRAGGGADVFWYTGGRGMATLRPVADPGRRPPTVYVHDRPATGWVFAVTRVKVPAVRRWRWDGPVLVEVKSGSTWELSFDQV